MSKIVQSILMLLMVFLSCLSQAEIFTWTDKKGVTHFGDKKIDGIEQATLDVMVESSRWEKYIIEINDVDNILTSKERKRINRDVNVVYQFYDNKLYFDIYKTVQVKIRLYKNQQGYENYLEGKYDKNTPLPRGIYFSESNEIVVMLNEKERWRTFWTIKHETSHAIISSLTPFVPAWLNEGIAENMEALSVSQNDEFMLFPHNENFKATQWLDKEKSLNVDKLLTITSREFYQKVTINGYQSYAGELVRMMMSNKVGLSFLVQLVHTYERNSRDYSSSIVKKHYIGGLITLQNDWNAWLKRSKSKNIIL